MKVYSPLANMTLRMGRMTRQGSSLVIESHEDSAVPTRVVASPQDVLDALGLIFRSPSVLLYLLAFPYFLIRFRRHGEDAGTGGETNAQPDINKPW